jgi:hypothetical protein
MRTEVIGPSRPAAAEHTLEKHAGRIGNALNRHGTGPALALARHAGRIGNAPNRRAMAPWDTVPYAIACKRIAVNEVIGCVGAALS